MGQASSSKKSRERIRSDYYNNNAKSKLVLINSLESIRSKNLEQNIKQLLNNSVNEKSQGPNKQQKDQAFTQLKGRAGSMKQPEMSLIITKPKFQKGTKQS